MNIYDATETAYINGQKNIIKRVEEYLLKCIEEWNDLGDRKYELANAQVYNHIRLCLDDLENLKESIIKERTRHETD